MFWHNFFWPYDSEFILMHLLSKYYNTNKICSIDTQYVSTQTWSVLQTHNILQYYHDLSRRFYNILKTTCLFFRVSRIYFCLTWANFMSNKINHNYVLMHLLSIQSWSVLQTYNTFQHQGDLFYKHTIRFDINMICLQTYNTFQH